MSWLLVLGKDVSVSRRLLLVSHYGVSSDKTRLRGIRQNSWEYSPLAATHDRRRQIKRFLRSYLRIFERLLHPLRNDGEHFLRVTVSGSLARR